jgi:hypothetical protein
MPSGRTAAIDGILFFFFWLIILLAGADFPPPAGFLWLVIVVAVCASVVYWRILTYIQWSQEKKRGRLLRVAVEGFLAGVVVATPFILFGSGEPSVPMQPIAYLGWFAILGLMGMLNSLTLYTINAWLAKRSNSDQSGL